MRPHRCPMGEGDCSGQGGRAPYIEVKGIEERDSEVHCGGDDFRS